jgi:sodium/proline symporter
MLLPTYITFAVYFVILLAIGLFFYGKNVHIEDYLLGGRRMGAWVTALSAQASDMSGWLLMGLPGAAYLYGVGQIWIAIGLFAGTVLNWLLVSPRLRIYTEKTASITLPSFFESRFGDPTGLLRIISAIVILIFFTIYCSSGLVATGKLFESTFNVPYKVAVIVGGGIIITYTFLGGFMAVCWTDLFQGMLMIFAIVAVPAAACFTADRTATVTDITAATPEWGQLVPEGTGGGILAVLSLAAWGLGYFGQPHILARFMSAASLHKLRESVVIATIWVAISLAGAVIIGIIGRTMFGDLADGDQEKVFIYMIQKVLGPWLGGIMLAAILSAIMSTIDSQLLVSSSALTEDFYQKAIKRNASEKEAIFVGRICVIIISAIALVLALRPSDTILGIVAYAWGGFGAAFGPLVLFALFSRRTSWQAALAGMVTGTVVLVVWKQVGLSDYMYEIVPGFAANCIVISAVNLLVEQRNTQVTETFDLVRRHIHDTGSRRHNLS